MPRSNRPVLDRRRLATAAPVTRTALTIGEFCRANSISVGMFYKLLKAGRGPKLMKVGRRRLVSIEANANWRAECERAAP
jgi:hypothetical protein